MESLEYYTTCQNCDIESDGETETVLEGVGEYDREANELHALPCPKCGDEASFQDWLEECEECGELHDEIDGCEEEAGV